MGVRGKEEGGEEGEGEVFLLSVPQPDLPCVPNADSSRSMLSISCLPLEHCKWSSLDSRARMLGVALDVPLLPSFMTFASQHHLCAYGPLIKWRDR